MVKIDGFQVIFHLIKLFFEKISKGQYLVGIFLNINSDSTYKNPH